MAEDSNQPKEGRRASMPTPLPVDEERVQLTGRVPRSLRRRLKVAAAALDVSAQDLQERALEEFLERRGY